MTLARLFLSAVAIYGIVVALAYFAQTWLLFPTGLAELGRPTLPASAKRLEIRTADGNRLGGVWLPGMGSEREKQPLLLGFAGNAWNAENMALTLRETFPDHDIVAFHYRGYAPSGGRPSADALMRDSLEIFDYLQASSARPVVAVGFSIGSGVAAYLARQRRLAGLILVTPFDSLEALAREHFSWAPVRLLLRHRMPTIDFVREISTPTAMIVAGRDTIIPMSRSGPLRKVIPNLVFNRTIEGAGHNDVYGHPDFGPAMREALASAMGTPSEDRSAPSPLTDESGKAAGTFSPPPTP
jgi:pimeloyl-ACP methyl ester carboxylesterase